MLESHDEIVSEPDNHDVALGYLFSPCLCDSILHSWDSQRPLAPIGLGDEHPAHRWGPVSLLHQFLPQFQKKPQRSPRLDRFDGFAIDARRSAVTPNLRPCNP